MTILPGSVQPLGFDDDSQQTAGVGASVVLSSTVTPTGTWDSGVIPCSNFTAISIGIGLISGPALQFRINFYADAAGTLDAGVTRILYDPAGGTSVKRLLLPSVGPFVRLRVEPQSELSVWSAALFLTLCNAHFGYPAVPPYDAVFRTSVDLAAGAVEVNHLDYEAVGPCQVYAKGGTQGYTLELDALLDGYNYHPFWSAVIPANTVESFLVYLPAGQVTVTRVNTSGATACTGTVTNIVRAWGA